MRIKRARGAVGAWTFTDESVEFERVDRRALDVWVATAARVAAPLEKARLLLPREVVFFGWDNSGDEPDGRVAVRSVGEIVGTSRMFLDDIERRRGFRAPAALHVLGSGDVVDEQGRSRPVDDLVWLNSTLLLNPMVTVCTHSDVWMPFDLRGRPHTALYARNASRLEAALQAAAALGLTVSFDDETPYARIAGFRLDNHYDSDGRAADLIVDENAVLEDE
jgi:hypothetical protein